MLGLHYSRPKKKQNFSRTFRALIKKGSMPMLLNMRDSNEKIKTKEGLMDKK